MIQNMTRREKEVCVEFRDNSGNTAGGSLIFDRGVWYWQQLHGRITLSDLESILAVVKAFRVGDGCADVV